MSHRSSPDSEISIVETKPLKTVKPIVLTGFQDTGLIGVLAVTHLINVLQMEEVAHIRSKYIAPLKVIVGSDFRNVNPFRMYANKDRSVMALINDTPAGLVSLSPFFNDIAQVFAEWSLKKDVQLVAALGSYVLQKGEKPQVVGFSTHQDKMRQLTDLGMKPLQQGLIGGFVVSMIDECIAKKIPWMMLFAPSTQMGGVDPEGTSMLIEGLNQFFGWHVETESLKKAVSTAKKGFSLRRR